MTLYPRILVVEDDPIVLLTFTLELQAEGFEVLGALTVEEARGILLTGPERLAAAVIALDPRSAAAAPALAQAVRALNPQAALLYTANKPGGPEDGEVMVKPFAPRVLAARVRAATG